MNKLQLIFTCFIFTSISVFSQSNNDSTNIIECVKNYNYGWYNGDTVSMGKALHPELVKRISQKFKDTGNDVINTLSYNTMMQYIIAGYGTHTPKKDQNDIITLNDFFGNIASVKVESKDIVEYLQLVRYNGEWKVLNVLWDVK
jgi:putative lumazine-binding protein